MVVADGLLPDATGHNEIPTVAVVKTVPEQEPFAMQRETMIAHPGFTFVLRSAFGNVVFEFY